MFYEVKRNRYIFSALNVGKKVLPPPQALRFSRKAGEGGELEAREPGDEHVWEQGRKRSFHFGGLIASLSLIKCQAVNTNRII